MFNTTQILKKDYKVVVYLMCLLAATKSSTT